MKSGKIKAHFLRGLLMPMAWLPFWALYLLSDVLGFFLYRVWCYRRKLVRRNLTSSFPDKPIKEIKKIERDFYLHLSDIIVETIKLLHVSDTQMRQRMTFEGVELTDHFLRQGKPVVAYFAHCGNWEWAPSITLWSTLKPGKCAEFCQIYRPLRDAAVDELMLRLRSRFGSISLPKRRAFLDLLRYKRDGIPTITGFMSDQKPSHGDPGVVVEFLHHPTAFISGTETVARRLDAAVVYWDMSRPHRGHYHITMRLLTEHPAECPPQSLTCQYAMLLEQTIERDPSIWLWTHNRWKQPVVLKSASSNINSETLKP